MTTTTLPAVPSAPPVSKPFHTALWVAQGLLALAFGAAGAMKVSAPLEQLQAQMPWVTGSMGGFVRLIGAAEVLGALGVVLPAATRVMPRLTGWAASGLVTIMILAAITHLGRGEAPMVIANFVLGGLAAFVAWGRFSKSPITRR